MGGRCRPSSEFCRGFVGTAVKNAVRTKTGSPSRTAGPSPVAYGTTRHSDMARQAASQSGVSAQSFGRQSSGMAIIDAAFASDTNASPPCVKTAPTSRAAKKRRILNHIRRPMITNTQSDNSRFAEAKKPEQMIPTMLVIETSIVHRFTAYDAAYPVLARRRNVPLATAGKALVRAAKGAGVHLIDGWKSDELRPANVGLV